MSVIYVDFDGTITPDHYPDELVSEPRQNVVRFMRQMRDKGYSIVIWSCRANPNVVSDHKEATATMKEYLDKHGVPYDSIATDKPFFKFLIDDRALSPEKV